MPAGPVPDVRAGVVAVRGDEAVWPTVAVCAFSDSSVVAITGVAPAGVERGRPCKRLLYRVGHGLNDPAADDTRSEPSGYESP